MSRVAVLIADPQARTLTEEMARLAAGHVGSSRWEWLDEGIACDIHLPDSDADAETTIRQVLGDAPIDVAIVGNAGRRKRLLIADMDSTMIEQECIDELAAEAGKRDEVAAVTEAAMRGEIDFESALRSRVRTLEGLPETVIAKVLEARITLRPGGRELVATMNANGARTMLVSGGFTAFTRAIASALGFQENRANVLTVENGLLTGTVEEPILGKQAKLDALQEACADLNLATSDVLAVGDGANDLAMIEASGLGVALHAKSAVAARADVRIDHGDLSALLYLQGYRRKEFA